MNNTNKKVERKQKQHIKFSRRNATLVGCFIYFCGISTGSFLCGLTQINNKATEEESTKHKADMMASLPIPRTKQRHHNSDDRQQDTQDASMSSTKNTKIGTKHNDGGKSETKGATIKPDTKRQVDSTSGIQPANSDNTDNTTIKKHKKKFDNVNINNADNHIKNITYPVTTRPLLPTELKLPTPILVVGMMKAGTTSIFGYFRCGLDRNASRLSHYDCKPPDDYSYIGLACGRRMRRNVQYYKYDAFKTIHTYHLYAELDAQENNGGMTLPQWSFLQAMHDQFPNATWILNLRDPQKWLQSINRWKDLRQRFIEYPGGDEFPKGKGKTDQEMIDFYYKQAQRVRDFVALTNYSHTLIEVQIDDPNAGQVMEDAFGISGKKCWGNRNVNNGSAHWDMEAVAEVAGPA